MFRAYIWAGKAFYNIFRILSQLWHPETVTHQKSSCPVLGEFSKFANAEPNLNLRLGSRFKVARTERQFQFRRSERKALNLNRTELCQH
jgi:hypothetical protein